jgi:cold shock CspA family protein
MTNAYLGAILFFNSVTNFGFLIDVGGRTHRFYGDSLAQSLCATSLRSGLLVDFDTETLKNRLKVTQVSVAADPSLEDAAALQNLVDEHEWKNLIERLATGRIQPPDKDRDQKNFQGTSRISRPIQRRQNQSKKFQLKIIAAVAAL